VKNRVHRYIGRLRICGGCGAMIALQLTEALPICAECTCRYWRTPAVAPWRLSAFDVRLLKQLGIGR
jgi:hypothetical protein